MRKGVKIVIGLAVVAVVAGGVFSVFGKKPVEEEADVRPAVEIEQPKTGDIYLYTDVMGTIEPSETVSVKPKMGGEVLEVFFEAGQYIEAGQPLCRIDSDALTSLRIAVESAQVSMNDANNALRRTQALFEGGTVSQESLEQAQSAATAARLQYESAQDQYNLQMEYTTVTAPISGVAESRGVDPHDIISVSTEIGVISAKDQIMVTFNVPERVMKNLQVGMTVTLDKYGTEYQGTITEIASVADQGTGLYEIKANVANGEALTTGSKAKVTVLKDRAENVLTIPLSAVSYDGGTPFIFTYENGAAKQIFIEGGLCDTELMEVKSGIGSEDMVITSWSNELSDGVEVMPVDESQDDAAGTDGEDMEEAGGAEAAEEAEISQSPEE